MHKKYDEIQVKFCREKTSPLRLITGIEEGRIPLRNRWTSSPNRSIYGMPGLYSA